MAKCKNVIVASVAILAALPGCNEMKDNPKQVGGGVLGAAAGAIVGAQFGGGAGQLVGVALGTLLGAFAGSEIGRHFDESDHRVANAKAQQAFQSGHSTHWANSSTGHSGDINVGKTYHDKGKVYRKFTQKIYIDGKEHIAHGTACKQADGTWKIIN